MKCIYFWSVVERRLLSCISQDILKLLDFDSLGNAENVSQDWKDYIIAGRLLEKLLQGNVVSLSSMCCVIRVEAKNIIFSTDILAPKKDVLGLLAHRFFLWERHFGPGQKGPSQNTGAKTSVYRL